MSKANPLLYPHVACGQSYSNVRVLKSVAGYYIGTVAWVEEFNCEEPGSRESDYYATREEAEVALATGKFNIRRPYRH